MTYLLRVFSKPYERGLTTSIFDGATECIIDAFPRTPESKLAHHLPDQVVVGPQESVGLNPAGEVHELPVTVVGNALVATRSPCGEC